MGKQQYIMKIKIKKDNHKKLNFKLLRVYLNFKKIDNGKLGYIRNKKKNFTK